jgi:hypothetical protein
MARLLIVVSSLLGIAALLWSCGDKLTLPDLPAPNYSGVLDTSYIQITPIWTTAGGIAFDNPEDVRIGYDRFIYVCDTGNDRVVKLDLDGTMIESYAMRHPVAVTQDRGLDLLAVAGDYNEITVINDSTRDTTWFGNSVYRRNYAAGGDFESVFTDSSDIEIYVFPPGVTFYVKPEYTGIQATLTPEKNYYVVDFLQDRILKFDNQDTPYPRSEIIGGEANDVTDDPWDVFAFEIVDRHYLAYTQTPGNFSVQILSLPAQIPIFNDTIVGLPELVRIHATGRKQIVVDERSNYYVLLNRLSAITGYNHFLLKFDRYGDFLGEFGTEGSGEKQFRNPRGLAYKDGILYIADSGNDRIVRYQLATEVQE